MTPHGRISNTTTHTHSHTPIQIFPQWYTHGDITAVTTPVSFAILDTPNSSWYYGELMECQDMLWRSRYHPTTMGFTKLSFSCWLFKKFSYALLIKIYLVPIIQFSAICASISSFISQAFRPILSYNPYQMLCFLRKFFWIQVYCAF